MLVEQLCTESLSDSTGENRVIDEFTGLILSDNDLMSTDFLHTLLTITGRVLLQWFQSLHKQSHL